MGDAVGMAVGMLGSLKSWLMAGGTMWLSAMVLVMLMWFARWFGTNELRWWTAFLCAIGFVSCLVLAVLGEPANVNAAANWGVRWLYPIGGMLLFYVAEHARFVLVGGGEKK